MTEITAFYDLPVSAQDLLLVFHAKAKEVTRKTKGFSGRIVMMDNGEHVFPRQIAAKYPIPSDLLTSGEAAQRFVREIKLQAGMHYHPNVHWPFEVMLLLGTPVAFFRKWRGDLSDLIEDPEVADEARLCILIQVLAGLIHCHSRGVVCHQDLKPENIFIRDLRESFGDLPANVALRPLIADFGSVNLFREAGIFAGSRPYMAPEQWDKAPLTEHTSAFAIGVILHELMSRGEHPNGEHGGCWHREEMPGFGRWQRNKHWRRWKEAACPVVRPLVDTDLANIVARCLEPRPSDRPSLVSLQSQLLETLRSRSISSAEHMEVSLTYGASVTCDPEWEYLNKRIELLERAVLNYYRP